jgi:hypothetical protein
MVLSLFVKSLSLPLVLVLSACSSNECLIPDKSAFVRLSLKERVVYEEQERLVLVYHEKNHSDEVELRKVSLAQEERVVRFEFHPIEGRDYYYLYFYCLRNGAISENDSPTLVQKSSPSLQLTYCNTVSNHPAANRFSNGYAYFCNRICRAS